jgi:antitoxin VapB
MEKAKLFFNGQSQAVRLPKDYRFEGKEVGIRKVGSTIILYPLGSEWATFLDGVNDFTDDFMENGRNLQSNQKREIL